MHGSAAAAPGCVWEGAVLRGVQILAQSGLQLYIIMPPLSRQRRLVGVLQQMLETVQSRTAGRLASLPDADTRAIVRQRRHVEWLCDHDIRYVYGLLFRFGRRTLTANVLVDFAPTRTRS